MSSNENSLDDLSRQTEQQFVERFGRAPSWIVAAPGRVNIIGEHTDYNGGFVMPMDIERYVAMAADRPTAGGESANLVSTTPNGGPASIDLKAPIKRDKPEWANYCRGVLAGFIAKGINPGGFDALINSSVPVGGGLSSSAALEVATATLIETITGQKLEATEKALLCQKAEHEYAGVPCGIMDQFASVMAKEGHLLLLDCLSQQAEHVPFTDKTISVLITNTNVKHALTDGGYAERRNQCQAAARVLGVGLLREATVAQLKKVLPLLHPLVYRRAHHVISENDRTVAAAEAFRRGDWDKVGSLMYASHASLRDDFSVSCKELDTLVEIFSALGRAGGVIGARMTGAGFGGCTVALVKTDALEAISATVRDRYTRKTGIEPTLFHTRPAAGARVLRG
jgi:galactokinase